MKRSTFILLLVTWLLAGCASPTDPVTSTAPTPAPSNNVLRLAASDLAVSLARDLAQTFSAEHNLPVQVTVYPFSELDDIIRAGQADLVVAVNPPLTEFAAPLGFVTLHVVTHPSNNVHTFSSAGAQAAFDGQITQWSGLGGGTTPINIWVREDGSDGALALEQSLLSVSTTTLQAYVAPTWATLRESVAADPQALSYLPESELSPAVQAIVLDTELRLLVAAYALKEPTGPARDFVAWTQSQAGQNAVGMRHTALMP